MSNLNMYVYSQIFVSAIFNKSGSFNFTANGRKYVATLTVKDHTAPMGRMNFEEAATLAKTLATTFMPSDLSTLQFPPFRVGSNDFTLTIAAA